MVDPHGGLHPDLAELLCPVRIAAEVDTVREHLEALEAEQDRAIEAEVVADGLSRPVIQILQRRHRAQLRERLTHVGGGPRCCELIGHRSLLARYEVSTG